LRTAAAPVELLAAARAAAGPELVINARTDGYLLGVGDPATRFVDTVTSGRAYLAAGADVVFVPGTVDPRTIRELVVGVPGPVNVMAGPGAPPVAELAELGVARVSVGPALAVAAYDLVGRAAHEVLEKGTWGALDSASTFGELNGLFRG
jgi:2-methylisocitrate lyase-like PEP mutase family enzyme